MSILAATILLAAQTPTTALNIIVGKTAPELRPLAFAPAPTGSKFAVTLEDGSVRIIDAVTHQTIRTLDKHPQPCYAVAWSPDGLLIATGDETARVWISSAVSGKKLREYRAHIRGIQKLSFNVSSNLLISTGKDDTIKVYDLNSTSPKESRDILGKGINFYGAAFSPTLPTTLLTATLGPGPRFYDAKTGSVSGFLTGHDGQGTFDVDYNPTGTRAISAGRDSTAILWDTKTDKKLGSLKGHTDWVMDAAFTPNGKFVATSSTDATVKVWNTFNYQKVVDLPQQSVVGSPLCFTSDGKTLITVSDQGYLEYNAINPPQPNGQSAPVKASKAPAKPVVKPTVKKTSGKGA